MMSVCNPPDIGLMFAGAAAAKVVADASRPATAIALRTIAMDFSS
jgi:hypothetical protein